MPLNQKNQLNFERVEHLLKHAQSHAKSLLTINTYQSHDGLQAFAKINQALLDMFRAFIYKWRGKLKYLDLNFFSDVSNACMNIVNALPEYQQHRIYNVLSNEEELIQDTYEETMKLLPKGELLTKKILSLYEAVASTLQQLDFQDLHDYLWLKFQRRAIQKLTGPIDTDIFKSSIHSIQAGIDAIAPEPNLRLAPHSQKPSRKQRPALR